MIPASYETFLVASSQASAALIGLLFVSVSIAPERIFGGRAESEPQAKALSAFTALANVFFISFTSLIPTLPIGPVVVVIGAVAMSQTFSLLLLMANWRREGTLMRGLVWFVISAVIYLFELAIGIQLWGSPTDAHALTILLEVLLGAYAIGLRRAWELLGASPRNGLLSNTLARLGERLRARSAGTTRKPESQKTTTKPDDGSGS